MPATTMQPELYELVNVPVYTANPTLFTHPHKTHFGIMGLPFT